jgi:hypothetical protein
MSWSVLVPIAITFVIVNVIMLVRAGVADGRLRLGGTPAARSPELSLVAGPVAPVSGRSPGAIGRSPSTVGRHGDPAPTATERRSAAGIARSSNEVDVLWAATAVRTADRCREPGCDHKRDHRRDRLR